MYMYIEVKKTLTEKPFCILIVRFTNILISVQEK